jgi:hypothetical protein
LCGGKEFGIGHGFPFVARFAELKPRRALRYTKENRRE